MGFSTLMDIIGSMIIGGIILMNLANLNSNISNNSYFYGSNKNAQVDIVIVASMIDRDFNLIGYNGNYNMLMNDSTIIFGDTSSIQFLSDIDNNGSFDTVYYYVSNTDALAHTPNPRDRILYRKINSQPTKIIGNNVTEFRLEYFDGLMNKIPSPINFNPNVNFIRIAFRVESSFPINDLFADAIWRRMTVTTKNIVKS